MDGDEFVGIVVDQNQLTIEMSCFSMAKATELFRRFLEEDCFTLVDKEDPIYTVATSTCDAVEMLWRRPQVVVFEATGPERLDEIKIWAIGIMEQAGFKQRTAKLPA